MIVELRLVADLRQELGESVLWDDHRAELVWIDIHKGTLWRWLSESGALRSHQLPDRVGAIGLTRSGRYVMALATGFGFFDPETEKWEPVVEIEPEQPHTRLNDGRCDHFGNFVCGGMRETDDPAVTTALYRFRPDGRVETLINTISCANSTCFAPNGRTMYFSDMPTGMILAYAYDPDGPLRKATAVADLSAEPGLADGSSVDSEGCVWNAQWGGAKLVRYSHDGTTMQEIKLPISNPTCVAFGGSNLKTLYITSATFGLTDAQRALEPHAGSVFSVDLPVSGLPEPRFAD